MAETAVSAAELLTHQRGLVNHAKERVVAAERRLAAAQDWHARTGHPTDRRSVDRHQADLEAERRRLAIEVAILETLAGDA